LGRFANNISCYYLGNNNSNNNTSIRARTIFLRPGTKLSCDIYENTRLFHTDIYANFNNHRDARS
jgi:hypothetical protein